MKLAVTAEQFSLIGNNKILLYTRGTDIYMGKDKNKFGYNLFIADSYGNIIDNYFEYNQFVDNLMGINIFAHSDNETWVHYGNNDTIYSFNNNGSLSSKYMFDFGTHRIPIEKINDSEEMRNYKNKSKYSSIIGINSSNEYSLINFIYKNRVHLLIKDNNSDNIVNIRFLENDIDQVSYANPSPILIKNNGVFFVKDYESISKRNIFESSNILYNTILDSIKEDDNPFISIAYLKSYL
jgi:hypothetical protein